ncbi:MAG TPA: hypothetical protein VFN75_11590 [Pseudonocardiaceae bacterium]|nr:hypothetical protein [Pseudonocardiaceae bacterium]
MNVVEIIRFAAELILVGTVFRLIEMHWGGQPGFRGQVAQGLGVVY